MFKRQGITLSLLILLSFFSLTACGSAATPANVVQEPAEAPVGDSDASTSGDLPLPTPTTEPSPTAIASEPTPVPLADTPTVVLPSQQEEEVAEPTLTASPDVGSTSAASPDVPSEMAGAQASSTLEEYPVPDNAQPHDVAPAPDGTVWYTAQGSGELGRLDPATGETRHIPLGSGSAPHGVIVGPDGAAWVTDSGLNAIVRVDPETEAVQTFPLPEGSGYANLNTASFDGNGVLWFTGQSGFYGRLDPASGQLDLFEAPRGRGPYGIATTPPGEIYYVSLAGSHLASVDLESGEVTVLEPPTPGQGARRVWSDSQGRLWISEWNAGQLGMYDPATETWREWPLPGDHPQPYAVYVDEQDMVWLSDFGANAMVRFDPAQEQFEVFPLPSPTANVRQILGRPGEVWGAESGASKLVVIRTAN